MAVVKKDRPSGDDEAPAKRKATKKSDEVIAAFQLPTEMTEPANTLSSVLALIYGERKIGKTSLAAQFPDALILAFEIGYKGLRVYKHDIDSWLTAKAAVKAIKKDKRFKTVVLDTVDLAYKYCEADFCKRNAIDDPSDMEWGRGWRGIKKEFEGLLTSIAATGKGVIMLAHSEEKEIRPRKGEPYDRIQAIMSKAAREITEGMVDIWAYYQFDGQRRVLTILGDDHIAAGHRFGERFRTPDGTRLRNIDMGNTEQEAYKNFVLAFNNKYTPKDDDDLASEDPEPDDEEEEVVEERPRRSLKKKTLKRSK